MIEDKFTVNAVSSGNGRVLPSLSPSLSSSIPSSMAMPATPTAANDSGLDEKSAEKNENMRNGQKADLEQPSPAVNITANAASDKKEEATMTAASASWHR